MTAKRKAIEARYGKPLVEVLVAAYNRGGLAGIVQDLGIPKTTAWYWLVRSYIHMARVAVPQGKALLLVDMKDVDKVTVEKVVLDRRET